MVDLQSQYQRLKDDIDSAISAVLQSSSFIKGPEVKEFEESLAAYCGVKNIISCANGTDAIHLALRALNLEKGSEVITPSFSYAAFAEMTLLAGLKPVFCEVNQETFLADCDSIESLITEKTRVIAPVHLFGQVADMEKIRQIAGKHNLYVIEDNAQAIGADYVFSNGEKRKSGCMSDISTTSFFPSKNLGCFGDGGAVMTDNPELAEKLRMLANHGQKQKYVHEIVGMNSRLDTIQAAALLVKLKHLDDFNNRRNKVADYYDGRLKSLSHLRIPGRTLKSNHVFHQYTIKLENEEQRNELQNHLKSKGIPTMIYYPIPLHRQTAFQQDISLPLSEKLAGQVLSLPISTEMDEVQLDYICTEIENFIK